MKDKINVETNKEMAFKDLSLLEKFLIPIGAFSSGFCLGTISYPKNYEYMITAGVVGVISLFGAIGSIMHRGY